MLQPHWCYQEAVRICSWIDSVANVIAGETLVVKLRGKTIEEMLVKDQRRALKLAFGENPKR